MHKIAIDQIIASGNLSGFLWWVPLFVAITLVHYLAQYVQVYQMRIVGEKTVAQMREDMMSKLQVISLRYFSEGEVGRIVSRPINDANVVRIFLRTGLTNIILATAQIAGSIAIIFFLDVRLALFAISILPLAAFTAWFLGRFSRTAQRRALLSTSGLLGRMQENFSGMKVIKSFAREDEASRRFGEAQAGVVKATIRAVIITATYQPVVFIMRVLGTALILYYGAVFVNSGEITIGTLIAFTEYQFQYFQPLIQLVTAYDQYQSAMAAIERMFDLIDTNVEVQDPPLQNTVKLDTIDAIEFQDVTFGYNPKMPVIKNISFTMNLNKKLAIVGPTGAGKSTIINLLSRFYDPVSGRILINGIDCRNVRLNDLRSNMSIVLQDSFLFPMSVKDNIRYGRPEATDEEVVEAAKTVGADEFIEKLPDSYDYIIQENSSNISIGQRQLISFARTLLMNPRLLILDEATSSIDPYTELVVQEALKNLLKGRLAIIIAHRLSTIRLCDEIIVIDHGEIVEKGSHSELMKFDGLYSSFYKMQFREEKGMSLP
jgi:ATP-binding cassette subfamily B protein